MGTDGLRVRAGYHRLGAAGERFNFDIEEAPEFVDFVSMAVMVSLGTTLISTAG